MHRTGYFITVCKEHLFTVEVLKLKHYLSGDPVDEHLLTPVSGLLIQGFGGPGFCTGKES